MGKVHKTEVKVPRSPETQWKSIMNKADKAGLRHESEKICNFTSYGKSININRVKYFDELML